MVISKYKVRNVLAERLSNNLLQISEAEMFNMVRYDGIKGFEQYSDEELFNLIQETFPEFELTEMSKSDNNNIYLTVNKENVNTAKDIEVDIHRIIQMKMLY